MTHPTQDNQGRNFDVPARDWNWGFICLLLGGWAFAGLVIAGMWFGGWAFVAGFVLAAVGELVLTCWAMGKAAPW